MVEAIRSAICFLSVISFPFTFKWVKDEVDFSPFIFLIAFQTVLGLVCKLSEVQKFKHGIWLIETGWYDNTTWGTEISVQHMLPKALFLGMLGNHCHFHPWLTHG